MPLRRERAVEDARAAASDGRFLAALERRVAIPTVSQDPKRRPELHEYLDGLALELSHFGFECIKLDNPVPGGGPLLVARTDESPDAPRVLCYGHADVVQGLDADWRAGRSPWRMTVEGDRIYGRGTADNKGQHTILLMALEAVRRARDGKVGFSVTLLIETSEETGSLGLREFVQRRRELLAADLLIGSDGPRLSVDQPTLVLGTRGIYNFDLVCELRESGQHSGNWGGLIRNPAVLVSHAVAALISAEGRIKLPDVLPPRIEPAVRQALAGCRIVAGPNGPQIDPDWGEPGLTPEQRVFGWSALEVLSLKAGAPGAPVNAIPPRAVAHCQIRYTADVTPDRFLPAIRQRLVESRIRHVEAREASEWGSFPATRLDPSHPLAIWAARSIQQTLDKAPAVVPNAGGTLPNDCFALILGLPTVWIPHSYLGCQQHAGDEHLLTPLVEEGLAAMAGLFFDLGEPGFRQDVLPHCRANPSRLSA